MPTRTYLQMRADRRSLEARRSLGLEFRRNREDQGVAQRALAAAAGIDPAHMARIENGAVASFEVLERIAVALGGDLSVRFYPDTGSALRDGIQAAIVESLIAALHPAWNRPSLEVPVYRPARGVIDAVLSRADVPLAVASEIHSQLRRLEQLVRWSNLKRDSMPSSDVWRFLAADGPPDVSALLVVRSTSATRAAVAEHHETLRTLYPARSQDAFDSLTTGSPWPGPALLWADVDAGRATIRRTPPRGIRVGR